MNHLNRINCRLWNFVSKLCCWFRRIWNYAFFWKNIWLNSPCPHPQIIPQITHHKMSLPLIEKSTEMSHDSNSTTREKKNPETHNLLHVPLCHAKFGPNKVGREKNESVRLAFFLLCFTFMNRNQTPEEKKSVTQAGGVAQKTPLPRLTRFRDVSFTPQNGLFWARMCASGWAFFWWWWNWTKKKWTTKRVGNCSEGNRFGQVAISVQMKHGAAWFRRDCKERTAAIMLLLWRQLACSL